MNLTLRVLWFDDTEEFYKSLTLTPLEEEVRSWGFKLEMELVTTAKDFMAKMPFQKYDLIVVDYNLGESIDHGEEFIKQIRSHNVFTEIIFYSASPTSVLWDAIHKNQLEGIFVSDRAGILQKLESVAEQSVHKVLDVNNMRGIVMAEVGDIDLLIEVIVKQGVTELESTDQAKIFDGFHEQASGQAGDTVKKLDAFKEKPTVDAMLSLCDSYKRWRSFLRLAKHHGSVKSYDGGDYFKDVLSPRNFLAHGTPRLTDDGYIFEFQGKSYSFSREVGLALRKTIMEYRDKFQGIRAKLAKKGA